MKLEKRKYKVRLAGVEFDALDIEFEIEKSKRPEPNTCELTVYNLSPDTRRALEALNVYDPRRSASGPTANASKASKAIKSGNIRVEIEAGYEEGTSLLFRGDLRRAVSTQNGQDWVTVIEGEDGGRSILTSRVSQSFPPGTPLLTVVKVCATAMGLGLGNILEVTPELTQTVYATGTVLDGQASKELSKVLRRARVTYSVQNGALQFLRAGQGSQSRKVRALVVSSETGMIGAPVRDATGELIVTTLLIPDIAPGNYVLLNSEDHKGLYQIVSVKHSGRSDGTEWYHVMNLLPG